ncbi:hypothetical protein Tco_1033813 [Tanacetum coccineum]
MPTTSPITTTVIPPVNTTVQFQSPFLSSPPKTTSQPERELIKKDKGNHVMSSKDAEEKETESDSEPEVKLSGSMVESSKKKYLKKFDFVTKKGDHVHLTKEQIKEQKKIEESVKADLAKKKKKREKKKGPEEKSQTVMSFQRERRGNASLSQKNWSWMDHHLWLNSDKKEILHKTEHDREIDFSKPLGEQDPIIKLNDLARKKRKHADDIHDYFRSTKKYKSSVQYKDHLAGTVLKEPTLEIFFRLHQGPDKDDHARTFSSFIFAEVDRRNLNPLKQMRDIEQLSSTLVLQVLRSSGIFTSVYVAVQILKKALTRALIQLGWQFQAERCRSPLRS